MDLIVKNAQKMSKGLLFFFGIILRHYFSDLEKSGNTNRFSHAYSPTQSIFNLRLRSIFNLQEKEKEGTPIPSSLYYYYIKIMKSYQVIHQEDQYQEPPVQPQEFPP